MRRKVKVLVCVGGLSIHSCIHGDPSGLREIRTSRKASCPSDSASRVN